MAGLEEIKTKIQGEFDDRPETLAKYSRDASIFEVRPKAVIHPKNSKDVENIVKWVLANLEKNPGLSITARSAGTDMSGGPLNEGIILDFTTHFNRILKISHASESAGRAENSREEYGDFVLEHFQAGKDKHFSLPEGAAGLAEAEPGVFYRDFEKAVLEKNLLLPCYTASKSLNTLGGMAANNSAGEKSLSYGQTKDYIEELEAVLGDGNTYTFRALNHNQLEQKLKLANFEGQLYRQVYSLLRDHRELIRNSRPTTSKNSAGYLLWEVWDGKTFNLAKLLAGSQGTLGLITKVKFRLVEPKPKSELLVIFMNDIKELGEVIKTVSRHRPESFESFDDHTFKLAMKFLPEMLKKMGGGVFSLGWKFLPELWMTLTGGIPKLVLIAEFTGQTESQAYRPLLKAQEELKNKFRLKTHVTKNSLEAQKYWTLRRESFNLLRQKVKNLHTAPFIDDIVVHPEDLPEFLPRLDAILKKYPGLIYTVAGHMGDANFHIIPLMDLANPVQRSVIPKLAKEVYGLVLEYRGSITAEHNDGLIRTPFLEQMYGPEMTGLFRKIKEIFDPKNIFNPGKKTGGSLKYSLAHIKKD